MAETLPDGWELIDIEDMTRGHLEKWQRSFNRDFTAGQAVYDGAIVRASIKAGWFTQCPWKVDDVEKQKLKGDITPILAKAIDARYVEVMELANPDPNS